MIADVISGSKRWHIEQGEVLCVLMAMPGGVADLVMADAPYSSGGAMRGDRMIATTMKYQQTGQALKRPDFSGDNRDQRSFLAWCALWIHEALRVAKPGAPICLFTDWRQLPITTDALQVGGAIWRGVVPWNKTEATRPVMGRPRAQCEYVVWGSNGPMATDDERALQVGVLPGFFECYVAPGDKHHMTGKPVDVMREIVKLAPVGGLALDLFAGSGSGTVAALMEGRRSIAIELLAHNVEIARNRCTNVEAGNAPSPVVSAQLGLL